jgi:hypothetical protein
VLSGTKEGEVTGNLYNVYRDGVYVANVVNETSFTDEDFDIYNTHTWAVTVDCETGGESNPVSKTLEACACQPVTNPKVIFSENTATITWDAVEGAIEYKISRDQITTSVTALLYTETAIFENATEYIWTIVTVCENGESAPVEVKETYLGISGVELTTFSIVPNPAHNTITINARVPFHKIEVINFLGQIVISQTNDSQTAKLDISNINNGVYFVRVTSEDKTYVKKFVKQ